MAAARKGNRPSYDQKVKALGREMMRRKIEKFSPKGPGFNRYARKKGRA